MRSLLLTTLLPLAAAHFQIISPPGRENDETKMANSPCGGGTTPSAKRTEWPLSGGPIQVKMGHDRVSTAVYLGVGSDPKTFNTTLVKPIIEQGIGDYCYDKVTFPTVLGLKKGDLATIQIITSAEDGKLFQCADIVFTDAAPASPLKCVLGKGVTTVPDDGSMGSAASDGNTDDGPDEHSHDDTPAATPSGGANSTGGATVTGNAAASTSSKAAASGARVGAWGVVVAGAVGVAAIL